MTSSPSVYFLAEADSTSSKFNTPGRRAGLGLIGSFGVLSAASTFSLLCYFLYCAILQLLVDYGFIKILPSSSKRLKSQAGMANGITGFLRSTLGRFLIYLFICDFIQGISFSINLRWTSIGDIETGTPCSVQGIFDQIGNLGTALWSLLMCFQTFCLLFLQVRPHRLFEVCASTIVWGAIIILPITGPVVVQNKKDGPFWHPGGGAWCWIGQKYQHLRLYYLYIWIFITLASCLIMYSLIYLKFAGLIDYVPGQTLRQTIRLNHPLRRRRGNSTSGSPQGNNALQSTRIDISSITKQHVKVARRLMWYPIVYAIVIIPVAICRLGALAQWKPPFSLYIFAGITYACSGLSNTMLFLFTRHTFIYRRVRKTAIPHISSNGVAVTIDVTRTFDYPNTPGRQDTKEPLDLDIERQEHKSLRDDPYIEMGKISTSSHPSTVHPSPSLEGINHLNEVYRNEDGIFLWDRSVCKGQSP